MYAQPSDICLINVAVSDSLTNWDFANRKGFGEIPSPNNNSVVCGEQKYFKGFSRLKYFCENREEIC